MSFKDFLKEFHSWAPHPRWKAKTQKSSPNVVDDEGEVKKKESAYQDFMKKERTKSLKKLAGKKVEV